MKQVILPGLVLLALSIPTLAARNGTRKLDGRFERADLDANGELTDIEFRATQSKKASIALSLHRFNYTDVNDDGIVTLTGTLPSFDEVRYATDDAWDIEGVLGVQSDLTVRS